VSSISSAPSNDTTDHEDDLAKHGISADDAPAYNVFGRWAGRPLVSMNRKADLVAEHL
jgi:hypothetical protein